MIRGLVNEIALDQSNHTNSDAVSLGVNVLSVTVRCSSDSNNNVWVGWNKPANNTNILQPSESQDIYDYRVCLDGNKLYVGFDPSGTGGRALITFITSS